MSYEIIIQYVSILMIAMGAMVFATNIIVEVLKKMFQKLPTTILAGVVAMIIAVLSVAVVLAYFKITFAWYFVPAAIILGFFVAYAAMNGFDKFKEAFEKLKNFKE